MVKLLWSAVVVAALASTCATAVLVLDNEEFGGLFLEQDTAPVALEHTLSRAAVSRGKGGIAPAAAIAALALTEAQRASYPHLLRLDCGGIADYANDGSVRDKEYVRELSASRTYVRPGAHKSTAVNAVRYAPTGDLNYDFPLPEGGVYNLTMFFEEVSPPLRAVGMRIFSVATEPPGKPVPGDVDDWSKVDIYATVGAENVLSLTTLVTVSDTDPKLSLLLGRIVENPEISFISLYKVGGGSTPTPAPRAAALAGELRLDCGGAGYARAGMVSDAPYLRDAAATKTYTHPVVPVSPTATVRYASAGSLTYDFSLPVAGTYNLSFYAAELAFSTVGRRVFSVATIPAGEAQGGDVTDWSAVDIFKTVGARRALFLTSLITVGADKQLSLVLDRITNNPTAGYLVLRSTDVDPSSGEPRYLLKVDCGGGGDAGRGIVRDVKYVRGLSSTRTFPAPASNYNPLATLRYAERGELAYDLRVQGAGAYRVTLYFAELFFSAAGKRVFSASTVPAGRPTTTQGVTIDWDKVDVYALVGKDRLLTISTTVEVAEGGSLSVVLGRVVNLPMLSRLDVRSVDGRGGVVTATPVATATGTTSPPPSMAPRPTPAPSPSSMPTPEPVEATPPPPPAPSAGDGAATEDSAAALFASINALGSEGVRAGLKKATRGPVNDELPADASKPAAIPVKAPAPAAAAKKAYPPKCELSGKKWAVEYQEGAKELVVEVTSIKQSVYVYKCNKSTLQIKGKPNSICIDACSKVDVVFENALSSFDIVNSKDIQMQCMGTAQSINIEGCVAVTCYLPEESKETAHVITSKSAAINIIVPTSDGDIKETPIPEQF
eukprot:TRINITY_DN506_c0_g2_i1.p1 TRINITY_DN506_c0_g2~~TRINITY_DN506_c0_g2_i1.p1  ORF type:complete len:835 (-),score=335.72 TRINITY_DN506_c0_g2_i1:1645-4149(-)